jgi:hypothetical protein
MSEHVGVGRTLAYALFVMNMELVQRSTVRNLLPTGTTRPSGNGRAHARKAKGTSKGSTNRTSERFLERLRTFERRGWISREGELIRILEPEALLSVAQGDVPGTPLPLLAIREAIHEVRREQVLRDRAAAATLVEQRRLELLALARLMQAPGGGRRRPVRIVNKTSAL